MTRRPRNPKPDSNQAALIRLLLAQQFEVVNVSPLGGDALDLFVGGYSLRQFMYEWWKVEVKPLGGKLTPGEREYLERHQGWPVKLVRGTPEECAVQVLACFGRVREGDEEKGQARRRL